MKKPEQQWETRAHRARRVQLDPAWAERPRAESFELDFGDRVGTAHLALDGQWVDADSAADPELEGALRAWLFARGCTQLELELEGEGTRRDVISAAQLSDPVPATAPRRIITLAPSNAEMVEALGAFDRVIACEDSSDFPPAVETLERLGPDLGPDLDRVAALAPDLVVSSLSVPGMERIVTGLRARGVPQLVLAPKSLDQIEADIRRTAAALHLVDAGERVAADFAAQREALRQSRPLRPDGEPWRVYLEWWPRPMFTPGGACYSNELIELAGGRNPFAARPESSFELAPEALVAADPDICFVSWCGVAESKLDPRRLIEREGLEDLRAARLGRVLPLDEAFAGRPGPRVLEAARRMAAALREL